MRRLECRCVVGSQLSLILALQHAWECTHREPEPGRVESVFHYVGVVGWGVLLMMLLCGGLRSRTGMTGRRTSLLPATARGAAAALGALDGTYLVSMFES